MAAKSISIATATTSMETSLLVKEFGEIPSADEFCSGIEPRNVPAVFRGCVKDWIAFTSWNPSTGGLDYLQDKVGSSVVEAMMSSSAPIFYGDIRRHERVEVPFSTFIDLCKQHSQRKDESKATLSDSNESNPAESDVEGCTSIIEGASHQIYLAQVPILIRDNVERVQLDSLRGDIKIPSLLDTKELASINLWMNNTHSRSSTHYDPHHNLLCVVAGCKHVVLWPPSASSMLYLMPIYSEASNHSSVALVAPDLSIHPRSRLAMGYSQKVILQEGDALFIPEGWLHQVDSDDLTIAVNFWWRSDMISSMLEHMDAYYLRRLLSRLIDKEMNQMLEQYSAEGLQDPKTLSSNVFASGNCEDNEVPGNEVLHGSPSWDCGLDDLAPRAVWALHKLIGLVHDCVNITDKMEESTSSADPTSNESKICVKVEVAKLYTLEEDHVAKILWNLDALTLQAIFLVMVHKFPRTLEALILHLLSPVGAEVLARKFDEMDKKMNEDDRTKFYQRFYSIFDDHFSAADLILRRKESFAHQAFKNVLDLHTGIHIEGQNPGMG